MSGDFHVLPTPKLKRAAKDCPLLESNSEAWIACCSHRFLPLAKRIAGDDSPVEDVRQSSWIKILQSINHACFDGPKACPWVHAIVTNTAGDGPFLVVCSWECPQALRFWWRRRRKISTTCHANSGMILRPSPRQQQPGKAKPLQGAACF